MAFNKYKQGINDTKDIIRAAKVITRSFGSGSITKLAKESILQYPLISSQAIPFEDTVVIAKALERQYAALFLLTISQNTQVDERVFGSVSDYLKLFHNNKDFDFASTFNTALLATAGESTVPEINCDIKSTDIIQNVTTDIVNESVILSLWDAVEESLDESILNDFCKPFTKSENIMRESINSIRSSNEIATEADKDNKDDKSNLKKDITGLYDKITDKTQGDVIKHIPLSTTINKDKDGNISQSSQYGPAKSPAIVRDQKLTMLEPTIIEVQLNFYGQNYAQRLVTALIGIKTMVYQVLSDVMIANMTKASTDSNKIFSFIKWSKGEMKFAKDFILGVNNMKEDAVNAQTAGKWFSALRKRKRAKRILGSPTNTIPPISTIAMTTFEVDQIKMSTGVDLMDINQAKKMMNTLYLLGFIVEDVTTGHIYTLFDGFDDFAEMSVESMAENNKRNADLTNIKDVIKLIGSR